MSFDIPRFHISDNSPEALVIETIMSREHVSPEEAVRRALRGIAAKQGVRVPPTRVGRPPGELLFGIFSDEPDLMRRIAREARKARDREVVRDLSA